MQSSKASQPEAGNKTIIPLSNFTVVRQASPVSRRRVLRVRRPIDSTSYILLTSKPVSGIRFGEAIAMSVPTTSAHSVQMVISPCLYERRQCAERWEGVWRPCRLKWEEASLVSTMLAFPHFANAALPLPLVRPFLTFDPVQSPAPQRRKLCFCLDLSLVACLS
jgi:hypothetical protein